MLNIFFVDLVQLTNLFRQAYCESSCRIVFKGKSVFGHRSVKRKKIFGTIFKNLTIKRANIIVLKFTSNECFVNIFTFQQKPFCNFLGGIYRITSNIHKSTLNLSEAEISSPFLFHNNNL